MLLDINISLTRSEKNDNRNEPREERYWSIYTFAAKFKVFETSDL